MSVTSPRGNCSRPVTVAHWNAAIKSLDCSRSCCPNRWPSSRPRRTTNQPTWTVAIRHSLRWSCTRFVLNQALCLFRFHAAWNEAVKSRSRAPALELATLKAPASSDKLARQEPR